MIDDLVEASVVSGELAAGLAPAWVASHSRLGRSAVVLLSKATGARRRRKSPNWQPDEDEFLRLHLGKLSEDEIAKRLGRTLVAVHLRWSRDLGLPAPSKAPDILTCEQVAEGLGVDSKTAAMLIDRGILAGRRLPTDDVTRVVLRTTLLRFVTQPCNWCYIDPERVGLRGPRRTKSAYDAEFWAHARRLAQRAMERWDDEWWTPGQAGRHHGVDHRLINRDIHQGKLPAVRWGNWRILKSDAVKMRYGHGKGQFERTRWSERADEFLVLGEAVGLSTNALSAMMGGLSAGWKTQTVCYRLAELKRQRLVAGVIRRGKLKVRYNARTGREGTRGTLYADWRDYRARFPRLARAMDKLESGEAMTKREMLYARGMLMKQVERRGGNPVALWGTMSEKRLRKAYEKERKL